MEFQVKTLSEDCAIIEFLDNYQRLQEFMGDKVLSEYYFFNSIQKKCSVFLLIEINSSSLNAYESFFMYGPTKITLFCLIESINRIQWMVLSRPKTSN